MKPRWPSIEPLRACSRRGRNNQAGRRTGTCGQMGSRNRSFSFLSFDSRKLKLERAFFTAECAEVRRDTGDIDGLQDTQPGAQHSLFSACLCVLRGYFYRRTPLNSAVPTANTRPTEMMSSSTPT